MLYAHVTKLQDPIGKVSAVYQILIIVILLLRYTTFIQYSPGNMFLFNE